MPPLRALLTARLCVAYLAAALTGPVGRAAAPALPTRLAPVASDQPVPTSDFVRPLLFSDARLNSSGTRFAAFIANQNYGINVLVCDIASGKTEWTNTGAHITSFMWLDEDSLYTTGTRLWVRDTGEKNQKIQIQAWTTGAVRKFGSLNKETEASVYFGKSKPGIVPGTDYIVSFKSPPYPSGAVIMGWARPEDGSVPYCLVEDDGTYALFRSNGIRWVKLPLDLQGFWPLALANAPQEMIGLGPRRPGGPRVLETLNVMTGAAGALLYQDAKYEPTGIIRRLGYGPVIGVEAPQVGMHTVWLDPKRQKVQTMLDHFFPHSIGVIAGADRTETRFLVEEISDVKPPTYYLLDLEKHSVGLLKSTAPWIDPKRMRPTQVISYPARDGISIEAYLTLPDPASSQGPPPLVVLPHSGPWKRTSWGWDGLVQLLASRGYAVLQPNYRGSAGYDWKFPAEDRWNFDKMAADVIDGTRAVVASGLVDPHRTAIMGTGFGGFLAAHCAVDEPNQYRCVVALGGVYDWDKAFIWARKKDDPVFDELRLHWGRGTEQEDAKVAAENLLPRLQSTQTPFLVLHEGLDPNIDDITAKYGQASDLTSALRRASAPVVVGTDDIDTDNEGFATWVDSLEKIQGFLHSHLA